MSKVKQSPTQMQNAELLARINYGEKRAGLLDRDLAIAMRASAPTFSNRRKDPSKFTLAELRAISVKLKLSISQILGEAPI